MIRRDFIKNVALGGAAWTVLPPFFTLPQKRGILNAYYFRAHMYTLVPSQIREDMKGMASLGTDVVSVAVLEQDLYAAVENIQIIANAAEKEGIQLYAVPSRWGGMLAGAPKVPSIFTANNPQTNILREDGSPAPGVAGPMSSVHYPETFDFFAESLEKMLNLFPIKGIIWDEPKTFRKDFSELAIQNLGKDAPLGKHIEAACDFFSKVNRHLKKIAPEVSTNLFTFAHVSDFIVETAAKIDALDYYGCDGRPWKNSDGGTPENSGKFLLGKESGERFLTAAKKNNKQSLWLLENHNLKTEDIPLMEKRLPEVLQKEVDHLIYYYYPRSVEKPDEAMRVIKKALKKHWSSKT